MQLTHDNYYTPTANQEYLSVSLLKQFNQCEAKALAMINGEYEEPPTQAMLVGSYLHSAFESDEVFERFQQENDIYTKSGKKKADFEKADRMIDTLKQDDFAMFMLEGQKEQIMTGTLWGVPFKIKIDNINFDRQFFSDIKTCQNIRQKIWSDEYKTKVSFIRAYDYVLQMALYREIIRQNTNELFSPYIVAVSKEDIPDKAVIEIPQHELDSTLTEAQNAITRFKDVKEGLEPSRCEQCAYCRQTKRLTGTVSLDEL